ncbi:hypothetical protein [Stieleria varia]|uniref:Uncharacterized protein n=1 Tax=Stieleria varia TaxID=2528005 RepID=A0A5C6A355_9BACT|nr:hypothetical protein [Stieleria varia]TWT93767.1 hypothetical protein Pla52n_55950 [Stieleria varia]
MMNVQLMSTAVLALLLFGAVPPIAAQDPDQRREVPNSTEETPIRAAEPREFQMSGQSGTRESFGHLAEFPGMLVHNDVFSLLQYKPIRNAIEVTDEQATELAKAQIEQIKLRQQTLRDLPRPVGPLQGDAESAKRRADAFAELDRKTQDLYRQILLPKQVERLTEIAFELRIQSMGIVAFLKDPQMVAELEISDEQQARLDRQAIESSQDLDAKVGELKRQVRRDIMAVLDDNQRAQLKSMLGQEFDWSRASAAAPEGE